MAGREWNGWKWLEMAKIGLKEKEITCLNDCKWLEIAGVAGNGQTFLEMV